MWDARQRLFNTALREVELAGSPRLRGFRKPYSHSDLLFTLFDKLFQSIRHFPLLWARQATDKAMKSAAWLLPSRGLFSASILTVSCSNL